MQRYIVFNEDGTIEGMCVDDIMPFPEDKEYFLITNKLCREIASKEHTTVVKADGLTDTSIEYDDINLVLKPTPVDPSIALNKAKADKITQLKQTCESNITSGFESACLGEIKKFDCADYDQRNILGLVAKAQLIASGGQTDGLLEWKATGEPICYQWTPQQVIQLGADMYTHIAKNLKKEQTLRIKVNEATTIDEVNAIVWE